MEPRLNSKSRRRANGESAIVLDVSRICATL